MPQKGKACGIDSVDICEPSVDVLGTDYRCRLGTLHAARWGQNLPKPSGGCMRLSSVTTSRCLIRPLQVREHNTDHILLQLGDRTLIMKGMTVWITG